MGKDPWGLKYLLTPLFVEMGLSPRAPATFLGPVNNNNY